MATVHLIDASPYIFRAWYSLPDSMVGARNEPVNAIYGYAGFLIRYVREEEPTHLAVAFDGSLSSSFRTEIYPEYKANRESSPPELKAQFERCRLLTEALGMTAVIDDRYEADDIIGTLCRRYVTGGHEVVIVSPDKDLTQLVDDGVSLYDFATGSRFDANGVLDRFGVMPGQIPDFLGLAGDSVDNIPGVPGIGKKTATALLGEFEHLEDIYANLDRVPELPLRGARSVAKRLEEHQEMAFLSRRLATVADDAPSVGTGLREINRGSSVPELLDPLLGELGFGRIRYRIRW
jgi:5'-3' exonuclease